MRELIVLFFRLAGAAVIVSLLLLFVTAVFKVGNPDLWLKVFFVSGFLWIVLLIHIIKTVNRG